MVEQEHAPAPARAGEGAEPRLGSVVGTGTLAAALFVLPQFVPPLVFLALASPFPLILQRLAGGAASAALAAALAAALVAAFAAAGPAASFVLVFAAPALLIGHSLARGRGLLRGCEWAFAFLAVEAAVGLLVASGVLADRVLAPLDQMASEKFLADLRAGGATPEQVQQWTDLVASWRAGLAVVFPAAYIIGSAILVAVNAALVRLYLARRDPGWLEDGEFERVRWPLALVMVFILAGAAVAVPVARPVAYNVLLVTAFFFVLQGLAVVAFYARRLAGPPLLRVLVVVLVLANPWQVYILGLLGLFDNFFDFRHWAEVPPPGEGGGRE